MRGSQDPTANHSYDSGGRLSDLENQDLGLLLRRTNFEVEWPAAKNVDELRKHVRINAMR